MPNPLDIPKRPRWRDEPITMVGRTITPATYNADDRARIDERLSTVHDTETTTDDNSDRLSS